MNATTISIKKAALINAISKYSNVVFMLIANAILARILSPSDYGIVAMITVFVSFFNMFSDMGLGTGVIQNKELDMDDINNIFSCTIYMGGILAILFIILSYPISVFYSNKVYIPIGCLLSISVLFTTLNMIPNSILMREKKFVLVAIRTIVVYMGSNIITIILALNGWKYYSLVAQSIISSIATFMWNYKSSKLKFKLRFEIDSVRKIIGYSSFNFAYDLLNYFGRNLDNILTGKFMGSVALVYYIIAYLLMLYPVQYLTNVITPVLHPILSDYSEKKEYIYVKYINIFKVLSLMGVFITIYCVFATNEIVFILYGEKWISIVPCVAMLSISIWFQMTTSTCTAIFRSLGHAQLRFKSGRAYIVIQIFMIIVGAMSKDIYVLACLVSVSFIIRFFVEYYFLIKKAFEIPIIKFYKLLIPEIIISFISVTFMIMVSRIEFNNVLISATYKFIMLSLIFIIGVKITKQWKYIFNILPNKIKRNERIIKKIV